MINQAKVPLSTEILNRKNGVFNSSIDGLNLVWDDDQILEMITEEAQDQKVSFEKKHEPIENLLDDNDFEQEESLDTEASIPQFTFGQQ